MANASVTDTLAVSPGPTSFGAIADGQIAPNEAAALNGGHAPVELSQLSAAGETTGSSQVNRRVPAGAGATYSSGIQSEPSEASSQSGQFTSTNAATEQMAQNSIGGSDMNATSSTPILTVSSTSLAFGDVALNTVSTKSLTLTSTGTAPVTINSATLTGTGFSASGATAPLTLKPGQSVTVDVKFDPTVAGAVRGQGTVYSNSSTNPTAVITLTGTGEAASTPQLTISSTSLAFGDVALHTVSTKSLTFASTGTAPVTISSATLTGTGFSASGATAPLTLKPGQSVTVEVQFDPTVAGAVKGQGTVYSNSSTNPTAVIILTGAGTAAPAALSALSCSSVSMTKAGSDSCTAKLTGDAPSGGVSVSLKSSNPAVKVPATVMIPANANSAGFTASVSSVTSKESVTLTASADSLSKTFALQLGTAVPTLTLSTTSVAFGDVQVKTASTQPVKLSSTGTSPVTIGSATLSGAGFTMSGASFPVTLNPGLAVTLEVQFDPATTSPAAGRLTIQSNSSSDATAVISLSGTGESASHHVSLSWGAPGSSSVSIKGYDIYRATSGSSAYQLLNSSLDTQTTYVDNTVQGGLTYDYIVKSVDSAGVESAPSNEVAATVP